MTDQSVDSQFILKTKQEVEQEKFDAFQQGPNRHYIDLYVQLKRNIEIKTTILEQEQNVCEIGFVTSRPHQNKEFIKTLKSEFETCKNLHQSLLSQNFPLQGKYDYSESISHKTTAEQEHLKYQQRLQNVKAELESSRKDIEQLESKIFEAIEQQQHLSKENDGMMIQELIKERFLRVNKMLRDVTERFVVE